MKLQAICCAAMLCCLVFAAEAAEKNLELQGLTVQEGQLLRNGKPYHGMGANYVSLFCRTLQDPPDQSFDNGLKKLAEADIPFVRFMACGFWPVDWELYFLDKGAYFLRLDAVVRAAEKHDIGLIPSLFWNMATVPDLVGEPMDQLGNPESRTIAFIEKYTKEVVLRYRGSAAIWGWEFGNEYNLHVDLPNASQHRPPIWPNLKTAPWRSTQDELSSAAMLTAFEHFAGTIRKYDRHRILITGNSIPRASAYHNSREKSWKKDSRAQFESVLLRDNPDPFSVISIHAYRNEGQGNAKNIAELVALLEEVSRQAGKPLFIGEFGAPKTLGADKEQAVFSEMLDAVETSNVPLSAFWVFDHPGQREEWNVTTDNERSYMLKLVAAANQRMQTALSDDQQTRQPRAGDVLNAAPEK